MKKTTEVFLVLTILILGGFLRFYGLDHSPPSLNWDEAAYGYNAFSILKTGHDEYGKYLPVFTRSFDEYKPMVPVYLIVPFLLLFGINETGVRMLPALSGWLTIVVVYLIARRLFRSPLAALFSALFFAIAPFAVFFSRVMYEVGPALLFFLLGYLLYLFRERRPCLPLAVFFFILSMYTYNSFRLLVPLFGFGLMLIDRREYFSRPIRTVKLLILGTVLLLPLIILTLEGVGLARFQYTSLFQLWPPPTYTGLIGSGSTDQSPITFLYKNPVYYFLWEFTGRYLAGFSPASLFIRPSTEPTLLIPDLAVLPLFLFPLWVAGLYLFMKEFKRYPSLGLLLILSPLPLAITWNWFQSIRLTVLFFVFILLCGYAAARLVKFAANVNLPLRRFKIPSILLVMLIAIISVWEALYVFDATVVLTPLLYAGNWQPGFRESMPIVASLRGTYDQVIIDSPHSNSYIFTLFYQKYPPDQYLKELNYAKLAVGMRKFYDYGKFHFRNIYWPDDRNLHKTLFVGTVFNLPEQDLKTSIGINFRKDVTDKDGNVMVRIVGLE